MKNKSIDDATPEEWNRLNKSKKRDLAWLDESDDAANDHPVYGENIPDNRLGKSYSNLINTMVDHPPHYNNGHIECIEAIEAMLTPDEYIGYLRGNSLKYLWRFRYKNKPIEDLRKARWYEERLISYMLEHPSDK